MKIKFIASDEKTETIVDAEEGQSLLSLGQINNQPLEGTCEGQMACSTCHVIIGRDWFDKLPPASEMEEDMLDMAASPKRTSRLACQIELKKELDGMTVYMPREVRNMEGM